MLFSSGFSCILIVRTEHFVLSKMAETKVTMERLNDVNWASWKFRMELLLVKEGLWTVVNEPEPENVTASWTTKDASARATIGLALDDSQLSHVMGASSANDMWMKLKGHHERGSLTNKIHVLRKLCSVRLSEGGNMSNHLAEISGLVHRLHGMGEKLAEHWIVAILLSSLPTSYNPLITALEGHPEADLKTEYVKGKLLDEWRRRCENEEDNEERALKTAMRQTTISSNDGRYAKFECYYCHEEGHFRRDCPRLIKVREIEDVKRRQNSGRWREDNGSSSGGNVCFVTATRNKYGSEGWLIDSGCTKHMTNDIGNLNNAMRRREDIGLADGRKILVKASGTGELIGCGRNGEKIGVELKNVLYVPDLKANVISVNRMVEEGYNVCFGPDGCQISKDRKVVLIGEKCGDLFYLSQPGK